ncbi:hypothetical protein CEXT_526761 [Caerostris extrusa]|uniref:Uncharacterized protein n=1 Tax=Caerostris extrusa TaxID=172846 RepID=A0AAV4MV30_CAEEX|nr:hypothetical protein CEXT_526761 [Caerostris extrusa]
MDNGTTIQRFSIVEWYYHSTIDHDTTVQQWTMILPFNDRLSHYHLTMSMAIPLNDKPCGLGNSKTPNSLVDYDVPDFA